MLSRYLKVATIVAVVGLLAGGSTGCSSSSSSSGSGDDSSGLPPFNSIDTSVQCPSDQIGWNFTTGGTSTTDVAGSANNGIHVVTASYGDNCNSARANDVLPAAAAKCDGLGQCYYGPTLGYDPAPGCKKAFDTTWTCGQDPLVHTGTIAGEAKGQVFRYDCGPPIHIIDATWGSSCGVKTPNQTSQVQTACESAHECNYTVQEPGGVDPAPGCKKDFTVHYGCGTTKVLTASVPGEALGKSVSFQCDAAPVISMTKATWSSTCGGLPATVPESAIDATATYQALCDGNEYCGVQEDVTESQLCPYRSLTLQYTCAGQPITATLYPSQLTPGSIQGIIGCNGVTDYSVGNTTTTTGQKGCVPRTCPYNSTRDPNTLACTPATKGLLKDAFLYSWSMVADLGYTTQPLDSMLAYDDIPYVNTLPMNTPVTITATLALNGDAVKGTVEPYLTTYFHNPKTGQEVEGFHCTLAPMALDFAGGNTEVVATQTAPIPAPCFDSRSNPYADAAARLGIHETDIRQQWSYDGDRLHFALDPEGNFGVGVTTQAALSNTAPVGTPNAPNPPGFFFNQQLNYTSLVDFYAQRDLLFFLYDSRGRYSANASVPQSAEFAQAQTGSIYAAMTGMQLRSSSALDIDYFDIESPTIAVDVDWKMIGDNPLNPLSPNTIVPSSTVPNLAQRNLRATVSMYPGSDPTKELQLGSIPLNGGVPAGSSVSGSFPISPTIRNQIFSTYNTTSVFGLKVCLDVDGTKTRTNSLALIAGNGLYNAFLQANCYTQDSAFIVTREIIAKPIAPAQPTAQTGATSSRANGDGNNSSKNDSGTQKTCTRSGGHGGTTKNCTTSTGSTAVSSGQSSNATMYSVSANATTSVNPAGNLSATVSADAEAYGFQILDPNDPAYGVDDMDITNTATFTITPAWDVLKTTINDALKKDEGGGSADPVKAEAQTEVFGQHRGVGLALEYRQDFGDFGQISIGIGAGVSVAFTFQASSVPPAAYPCQNTSGQKCYQAVDAATQPAAQKACEVLGGQLAEARTPQEFAAIDKIVTAGKGYYWTGGQADYQYPSIGCATYPTIPGCAAASITHFRWLTSDTEFATVNGTAASGTQGGITFNTLNLGAPTASFGYLPSLLPTSTGLVYGGPSQLFQIAQQSQAFPAVCEFDPAVLTHYVSTSLAVPIGAGGGLSAQYCWPSIDFGLCLQGSLNFVSLTITPTVTSTSTSLLDANSNEVGTRGDTNVAIPWELDLLGGEIDVVANFYFFSVGYALWSYPPFVAAQGTLASYDWPSREDCQGICQ